MAETITEELFLALDEDVRELLSIIHNIKIDARIGTYDKSKLERAILLSQRITAELYELLR